VYRKSLKFDSSLLSELRAKFFEPGILISRRNNSVTERLLTRGDESPSRSLARGDLWGNVWSTSSFILAITA
jgi:hypothetical protein